VSRLSPGRNPTAAAPPAPEKEPLERSVPLQAVLEKEFLSSGTGLAVSVSPAEGRRTDHALTRLEVVPGPVADTVVFPVRWAPRPVLIIPRDRPSSAASAGERSGSGEHLVLLYRDPQAPLGTPDQDTGPPPLPVSTSELTAAAVEASRLWQEYDLEPGVVNHLKGVAALAVALGHRVKAIDPNLDLARLYLAGLCHDLGKGSRVPQGLSSVSGGGPLDHAAVSARILREHGHPEEVAQAAGRHILDAILDPDLRPSSWPEKLVFYADKLVRHSYMPLERRLDDVRRRHPAAARTIDAARPLLRELEEEILSAAALDRSGLALLAPLVLAARDGPLDAVSGAGL